MMSSCLFVLWSQWVAEISEGLAGLKKAVFDLNEPDVKAVCDCCIILYVCPVLRNVWCFNWYLQVWKACGWKPCVDTTTFFSGLKGQLGLPQLVKGRAKYVGELHLSGIENRWDDIRLVLEKQIDVGDESDGNTQSDGIYERVMHSIIIYQDHFTVLFVISKYFS